MNKSFCNNIKLLNQILSKNNYNNYDVTASQKSKPNQEISNLF